MAGEILMKHRLIAILRDVEPSESTKIVSTLQANGVDELEISLSNKSIGYATLKNVVNHFKGIVKIGVGTVTSVEEVIEATKIGAEFIITPAYDEEIVRYCIDNNITIIPGVFTPSDVMKALNNRISLMKLFPANAMPLNYIKSLKGPFPSANFLAVGGVKLETLKDYLDAGFVGVAPGSDFVNRGATSKDLSKIAEKAKEYVRMCT